MKKKDKNKNIKEEETKCNCSEECDCGCQEGKECTCDESCNCQEEQEQSSCGGSCESCGGCGNIDPQMIIDILSSKNQELEDKYIRLQAEYLNFKTRTQGEVSRMLKYEGETFFKELLSVKDNFERAIMMDDNDLGDEVSKFLSGFKMILGNLTTILDKYEIKEIDCLGKEFDPNYEEAVLTEHDSNKPENVVLEVLTKGYMYKDKLLRPAMVKVNK